MTPGGGVPRASRREFEVNTLWMSDNPEIAVEHILKFFQECEGYDLMVDNTRQQFLTFVATEKL